MAEKSKIRYDDFISNVQPDPAKPESTIMLSGFVGHGPEGHARIYPDPTLGTWYDVPEADVVYSTPIADSKLGGSYVWVRASAQIKPGSAAPPATGAAEARPGIGMHPTPATHCFVCDPPRPQMEAAAPTPTPATHCFICPPLTQQMNCPTHPMACNITPATQCFICPPPTGQVTCPTMHPERCNITPAPTPATQCFICPPHRTLVTLCTLVPECPPPTPATQCFNCPPAPTQPLVCNIQATPTGLMTPCPTCPPPTTLCQAARQRAEIAAIQPNTAATICTMPPGCLHPTPATHCFICPPLQTQPMVCNVQQTPTVWCPTQPVVCNLQQTQPVVCGIVPPTPGCQQGAAQPRPEAVMAAAGLPNADFTVCTACTAPPMCPQTLACPTPLGVCPTAITGCWLIPSGVCGQAPQAAVAQPMAMAQAVQPTPTAQTHCFICPPLTHQMNCPTHPLACNITPATQCFICPPPTQQVNCPTHPVPCNMTPAPTPATQCFICPPLTQQVNCPTHPVPCNITPAPTPATLCFICPPHQTPNCTLPTICTQPPACPQPTPATQCFNCPPHQTLPTICTQLAACHPTPATHCFICPPLQTQPMVCNVQPTPTAQTHCFICPPHTQNCAVGAEALQARAGAGFTFHATKCLCQIPGYTPGYTLGCTDAGCVTVNCPTATCPSVVDVCTPEGCQQGGAQQHREVAAGPAHPNTAATVCTMPPGCGVTAVHTLCCLLTHPPICPPGGGFTLATQCICMTPGNTQLLCPPGTPATFTLRCFTLTCPPLPNGVFTPFGR